MTAEPRAPGRVPSRYQPARSGSVGTSTVPSSLRPRPPRTLRTPIAGMLIATGRAGAPAAWRAGPTDGDPLVADGRFELPGPADSASSGDDRSAQITRQQTAVSSRTRAADRQIATRPRPMVTRSADLSTARSSSGRGTRHPLRPTRESKPMKSQVLAPFGAASPRPVPGCPVGTGGVARAARAVRAARALRAARAVRAARTGRTAGASRATFSGGGCRSSGATRARR